MCGCIVFKKNGLKGDAPNAQVIQVLVSAILIFDGFVLDAVTTQEVRSDLASHVR